MTALAYSVIVEGTRYAAGTDHTAMPVAHVDEIRNGAAWVGGTAPALSVVPIGKSHIVAADLSSATKARAALGIAVDLRYGHIVPTGSAPTVAAQAAAGTSATAAVTGKDTAGTVTVTSGSASLAAGNQAVVTFNHAFDVAPVVVLTPGSAAVAALAPYVAAATTTTFTIAFGSAPSASTAYPVNFHAVGK